MVKIVLDLLLACFISNIGILPMEPPPDCLFIERSLFEDSVKFSMYLLIYVRYFISYIPPERDTLYHQG